MAVSAEAAQRLELRIALGDGQRWLDVVVAASEHHLVSDLGEAASRLLAPAGTSELRCERRRMMLRPEQPLRDAGILWGDRLVLADGVVEPTILGGPGRAELTVTSGPCAGWRFELGDGSFRLGRDPESDIQLPDPSLSRHHLDVLVSGQKITIADANSSNGTAIDGKRLAPLVSRPIAEHEEIEIGRTMVRITRLRPPSGAALDQHGGRIDFNRPPRVNRPPDPFHVDLASPPNHARKARLPLAASLLPLAAGVLLFVLMKSPAMLAIAGLSPLMAIGSYMSERRGGSKAFDQGARSFRKRLAEATSELEAALIEEAAQRRAASPDAASLLARVRELSSALWERRPGDRDFMSLRLGVADLPAQSAVVLEDGGAVELREEAQAELSERRTVPSVPCVVDLPQVGMLGLAGSGATGGLARWLMLQAAILHSPADLVIAAALSADSAPRWSWLKWLPHLRPRRVGLETSGIAIGRDDAESLLADVRDLVEQRRTRRGAVADNARRGPQLLVLVDEATEVDRALVSAAFTDAAEQGVSAIWLGGAARDLPGQAGVIAEVERERAVAKVTDVATGEVTSEVSADALSIRLAEEAARRLSPLRDIGELAGTGDIPKRVGLLELLGLLPPTPEALSQRWRAWRGDPAVVLGVGADGACVIDLRDEGPHALIVGTTGSGKSELLRTLVAAAAASAPPDRLSFLLVDYKGGAAFAPCAALPHVVDVVSDLDEHLGERALISLNAELKRRERILAEHGAKDLLDLIGRNPAGAPPLLVIAVDEFAKLREEIPDFVDGVVDIAQRGRSLGVHMVLAAQTTRNAFTTAIRANTNLRIALRVADEAESEEVIASPLAARIASGEGSRGRAFVRTGSGDSELREFQAAYVSGRSAVADHEELKVERFALDGASLPAAADAGPDSDAESDLVALGEAALQAQSSMGLAPPPPPWLPTMPELLPLEVIENGGMGVGRVSIGNIDLPRLQRQDPLTLDFTAGHVAVFGAGHSGKTTALSSTALALARSSTPEEVWVYGLDAGSGRLASIASLPHCGGVVMLDEQERVHRLLRMLLRRIEAGGPATIVLLLDDIGSFVHRYDRPGLDSPYEQLQQVLVGGRAASVHVMLTASRRGALPAPFAAHVAQRLVLRMPSEEEMLSLGLEAKTIRGAHLSAGRGFTHDGHEFQIAVPVRDGAALAFEDAASSVVSTHDRPPPIDLLPDSVHLDELRQPASLKAIPIGISDEDLAPAFLDLSEMHFIVAGPYRSGRSTVLATLARGVAKADSGAALHLLAPRRSPLRELSGLWTDVAGGPDACAEAAASLLSQLQDGKLQSAFVFIDDGGELTDVSTVAKLERLVRLGRDGGVRIVASVEMAAARGIALSWVRELRREGHGLLLAPDLATDGDLLGAVLPRHSAVAPGPGRGFLVHRGSTQFVQVAY